MFSDHGLISHLRLVGVLCFVVVSRTAMAHPTYTDCRIKAIVSSIGRVIYNIYLHPLRSYSGPWFARASRLPYLYYQTSGRLPQQVMKWHKKYGDTIRIAPNDLSFIQGQAWFDIQGIIYRTSPRTRSLNCHQVIEAQRKQDGLRRTGASIRSRRTEHLRLYEAGRRFWELRADKLQLTSNEQDHSRFRRLLSHAFSGQCCGSIFPVC